MHPLLRLGLVTLLAIAILPGIAVAFFARSFIYHPTRLSPEILAIFASAPGWSLERVDAGSGLSLNGLVRVASSTSAPWLLLFGGNASDLGGNQKILELIGKGEDLNLAVFAYRGYDGSTGSPTETALVEDAGRIVEHLASRFAMRPDSLVILGQSLGTGIASQLAARLSSSGRPPRGLVLVSPFVSVAQLVDELIPWLPAGRLVPDTFRTDLALPSIRCPILVVHGDADTVIPVSHGRALGQRLSASGRYQEVPKRGHGDLWMDPLTVAAVRSMIP